MLEKLLKFEDIIEISKYMVEHGYDKRGITIETTVTDAKIFEKLNEDIYYRLGGEEGKLTPAGDTICVNVAGLTFRYLLKTEDE